MVTALNPTRPCPVLVLLGEQGTAKSTAERMIKQLLDPNTAELRTQPRDERDVMIAARSGHVLAFDNISHISDWFSDALCRLVTGNAMATRELYTDADEMLFSAMRPVILNGIEEMVTRADLLDRSLLIYMPAIPETDRRPEGQFWNDFERARPGILGALLDAVSAAMSNRRSINLTRRPRMADFAVWVTAAEPSLGWKPNSFIEAYMGNRQAANALALEASLVAATVLAFASRELVKDSIWEGTATELLKKLNEVADETTRRQKNWPGGGKTLSDALRRVAPTLVASGVAVEFGRKGHDGKRTITIKRVAIPASPASAASPSDRNRSLAGDRGDAHPETVTEPVAAAAPARSAGTHAGDAGDATLPTLSGRRVRGVIE